MRTSLFLLISIFAVQLASAQNFILPLDVRPPYLSANFGELSPNHFHSGIDFKTEKVEGKVVRAIDTGYIARVQLTPSGYGHVLYVAHPNGFTSVYAHLKEFDPVWILWYGHISMKKKRIVLILVLNRISCRGSRRTDWLYQGNGCSGGPICILKYENRKTTLLIHAIL